MGDFGGTAESWLRTAEDFFGDDDPKHAQVAALISIAASLATLSRKGI